MKHIAKYIHIAVMAFFIAGFGIGPNSQNGSVYFVPVAFAKTSPPVRVPTDEPPGTPGDQYLATGDWLMREADKPYKALRAYEKAFHEFGQAGNEQKQGETLLKIGQIYSALQDAEQAIEHFELALFFFDKTERKKEKGITLLHLGRVYSDRGSYERALTFFQQSLALADEIRDRALERSALSSMGEAHRQSGRFTEALACYRRAVKSVEQDKEWSEAGRNWANIGIVHNIRGEYREALQSYQKALETLDTFDRLNNDHDYIALGTVHASQAELYRRTGEDEKATDGFETAIDLFQKSYEFEIAQKVAAQKKEALALNGVALIDERKCLKNETYCLRASYVYGQAQALQKELGDRAGMAATLHNLGGLYDRWAPHSNNLKDYYKQALAYYGQSLEMTKQMGKTALQARTLNNIGEVYIAMSDAERQTGHLSREHLIQALHVLEKAHTIQKRIGENGRSWQTLSNIGRVYERQGNTDLALKNYQKAITQIEQLVGNIGIEELTINLGEQAAATYQRAVLLLAGQGKSVQAFELTERARARTFLTQVADMPNSENLGDERLLRQEQELRLTLNGLNALIRAQRELPQELQEVEKLTSLERELQSARRRYRAVRDKIQAQNPEYGSLIQVAQFSLKKIETALQESYPDTTLLSYFVTKSGTLAFVIPPKRSGAEEMLMFPIDVGEAELETFVKNNKGTHSPSLEELNTLYSLLIAPLKHHLTTRRIGIIPHSVLHYLPFAALTDGRKFLGDEFALFTLPSASVLEFLHQKRKPWTDSLLALAYKGVPQLEYVEKEVKHIGKSANAQILLGSEANESQLRSLASRFSIVHLAAHGEFDAENPLFSRIYLAPESSQLNDGNLAVHEVYDLPLQQANLAVLSACQTGLGVLSRGDDIVGLTRAFMYAGAPSVVSTLWEVNDRASYELMLAFYKHLRRGKAPAEALQAAQRELRKTYTNPYFWAGFVLTGDPGVLKKEPSWFGIITILIVTGTIFGTLLRRLKRS